MEDQQFKWRIVEIQVNGDKLKIIADFAYAWRETTIEHPDGYTVSGYDGIIMREILEVPVVLTSEQIIQYLDAYWGNKYGPLDAQAQVLSELESMKGFEQIY